MSGFRFDPAAHAYYLDDRRLPSVTQVLKRAGLIDDRWFAQGSAEFGSAIHAACQYWDEDDLDISSVGPEVEPFLQGWISFLRDSGFKPDLIEPMMIDPSKRYAGRPDRITTGKHVIDIKSGGKLAYHKWQLAGYVNMLTEPYKYERIAVYLSGTAAYSVEVYPKIDYRGDLDVFMSALNITIAKEMNGIK